MSRLRSEMLYPACPVMGSISGPVTSSRAYCCRSSIAGSRSALDAGKKLEAEVEEEEEE